MRLFERIVELRQQRKQTRREEIFRRFRQFNKRTLLILTVVVAVSILAYPSVRQWWLNTVDHFERVIEADRRYRENNL